MALHKKAKHTIGNFYGVLWGRHLAQGIIQETKITCSTKYGIVWLGNNTPCNVQITSSTKIGQRNSDVFSICDFIQQENSDFQINRPLKHRVQLLCKHLILLLLEVFVEGACLKERGEFLMGFWLLVTSKEGDPDCLT